MSLLFGHPGGVFEGQLSAPDLLLAQVDVLPELSDGVQRGVVLETQTADLGVDMEAVRRTHADAPPHTPPHTHTTL